MPADRLLHARLGHSAKVSSLTDLEFRVWTTYVLAADDFGVMRADAVAFQAAHDALSTRPAGAIAKCIERLVEAGLVAGFEHQRGALPVPVGLAGLPARAVPGADAAPAPGVGRGEREDAPPVVDPSRRRPGAGASEGLRHCFRHNCGSCSAELRESFRTTPEALQRRSRRTSEVVRHCGRSRVKRSRIRT